MELSSVSTFAASTASITASATSTSRSQADLCCDGHQREDAYRPEVSVSTATVTVGINYCSVTSYVRCVSNNTIAYTSR
jgi:hypothetical protein